MAPRHLSLGAQGLSPHGRGNLTDRPWIDPWSWVYPRTGGGTGECDRPSVYSEGLSPHGRGNPDRPAVPPHPGGSIPARAGEPEPGSVRLDACEGLSPHGRGNQAAFREMMMALGSIPARAGEPGSTVPRGRRPTVYPRTGGGTCTTDPHRGGAGGLSPHGRGNPDRRSGRPRRRRSIPARAGEPSGLRRRAGDRGVYPRTGGGTSPTDRQCGFSHGLSPHGRGNLTFTGPRAMSVGSIPARAGEPMSFRSRPLIFKVYPRTGGGTISKPFTSAGRGVYPRTGGGTRHP